MALKNEVTNLTMSVKLKTFDNLRRGYLASLKSETDLRSAI
jgi:hypothetical protein